MNYALNKECNEKLLRAEGFSKSDGVFIKRYPIWFYQTKKTKHPEIFVQIFLDLENRFYKKLIVTKNGIYATYYTSYGEKTDFVKKIDRNANKILRNLCDKGILYKVKKGARSNGKKSSSRKK